jgi:hypothetical protein
MKRKQFLFKKIFFSILSAGMFFSSSVVFAQVKIGSNPTVINPNNNLEVESATAGNKVSIDKTTGKVTIADGSQGDEKILTSDANGQATWKPKSSIRVDETVFIGEQTGTYIVTNWANTFNALKDRVPLQVRAGSLPGWDEENKRYIIQETGYYRVFAGAKLTGTLAPPQTTRGVVYLGPWSAFNAHEPMSSSVGPVLPVFWQGHLTAGQPVTLWITNNNAGGTAQNLEVTSAFLSIIKLY